MVAAGFAWFLTSLTAANGSIPYTIGTIVENLPFAVIIHVLLAYPRGRLEWWVTRAIVASAYVTTVGVQFLSLLFHEPTVSECPGCPANALLVTPNDGLADSLEAIGRISAVVLTLAVAVIYAQRWRAATPPARRMLGPVLATGGLAAFLLALSFLLDFVVSDFVVDALFVLSAVVLSTVPLASLAGLLQSQLARSAVGSLIVELGQSLPPGELRDALARALGDPSLSIGYWLPEAEVFVDHEGRPLPPPDPEGSRHATWVERDGERIAALVHDESLLEDAHLIDAVVAAAGLALENERRLAALARSETRKPGPARRHAGRHVQDRPRRHLPRLQGRGRGRTVHGPGLADRQERQRRPAAGGRRPDDALRRGSPRAGLLPHDRVRARARAGRHAPLLRGAHRSRRGRRGRDDRP